MELLMARSLAGHDKDALYVVIGEDEADVILVNGKNRTMDSPKRKRKKHVQPIRHFPETVRSEVRSAERWTDDNVRKVIKLYEMAHKEEEVCQKQM
ncbi:MAG: RNA-binding protein [Lachnospiraceae bacterium]|nr:RNA-binding protein [Lachnospiraceae bacterium]